MEGLIVAEVLCPRKDVLSFLNEAIRSRYGFKKETNASLKASKRGNFQVIKFSEIWTSDFFITCLKSFFLESSNGKGR